jgi:hypothetical protein
MAKPSNIKVPSSYTAVSNTVTETTMASVALPAYSVKTNHVVRIRALVEIPDSNSSDTFALKLKLGSTVLSTVTAFDATDDDVCFIHFDGYIDASGELLHGVAFDGRTGQALANPEPSADVAFDTDTAKTFSITGTWSVASADNNAVAKLFTVELQPVD